jgi:uroporphyrinogen decarboxylase
MLTSRERVANTLARKPNDRPPYDFRAEPEVFQALRAAYGLASDEAVRVWARSDMRDIGTIFSAGGYGGYSGFGWQDRCLADGSQEDFWGVRRTRVSYEGGEYVDICHWPLREASPEEIYAYAWPDPRRIFDFTSLPDCVRSLNIDNEYWCMIEVESLFDRCWALRGMEQFMMDLLAEPELADYMLTQMADFFFVRTQMLLEASQGSINGIGLYNDLGTQSTLMISPETYRTFIKPRQQRLIAMAKDYGAKVFYHSCGAVEPLFADLIEIGVDIIDPLQLPALRVTPEYLVDSYGSQLVFHGGLNTQSFLQTAGPEEIRTEVGHLVRTLGRDGGYILSGSHLYQIDIPLTNIEAIHESL